jgi:hypothetical protein
MPMDLRSQNKPEELLESPHDILISDHSADELLAWEAPEFEKQDKSRRWYLVVFIFLAVVAFYAIFKNWPVMAITFIMIGVTGYLMLQREPRSIIFRITHDGIVIGNQIYDFDNMQSFWIFYNPPYEKILSIHLKGSLVPFLHIPVHDEDPVKIREVLMKFIPEIKQEKSMVDTVERILGM